MTNGFDGAFTHIFIKHGNLSRHLAENDVAQMRKVKRYARDSSLSQGQPVANVGHQ